MFVWSDNLVVAIYLSEEVHCEQRFSIPIGYLGCAMYAENEAVSGVSGTRREHLMVLHRTFSGPFNAAQAASALGMDVAKTRRLLAALAAGGWLSRVRQGWYITVPLDASVPSDWREDPWIVAATLYAPCYIGGWSACEHWGLTDQLFNVTYVVAGKKVAQTDPTIQGARFVVRSVSDELLFGTRRVWRRRTPVDVSDPSRTVVDIMDAPAAAGGALHAVEVLRAYFESEYADERMLLEYGDRLGRGTMFKRLGYLVEHEQLGTEALIEACRARISKGISRLDPDGPEAGGIVSRWNLRINVPRLAPADAA